MLDPAVTTLLNVDKVTQVFATGSGETRAPVLSDVSLSLKTGEIVALLGRSGSGKSTLLRIIAGLTRPTEGTVTISGERVNGPAKDVAMVFQSFALFPWLDVLDNVEIGPRSNGVPLDETRKRALKAIDTIGLDGFEIGLSQGIVRRHAPARRLRAGARHAAENPADGRAVLGARRANRGDPAHRPPRPLAGWTHADQRHPDGHPQHRGGGADGRPHPRAVVQSRPHRLRDPGYASASARSAGHGIPRARRADLRADDPAPRHGEACGPRSRRGGDGPRARACRASRPTRWPACSRRSPRRPTTARRTCPHLADSLSARNRRPVPARRDFAAAAPRGIRRRATSS